MANKYGEEMGNLIYINFRKHVTLSFLKKFQTFSNFLGFSFPNSSMNFIHFELSSLSGYSTTVFFFFGIYTFLF